MELTSEPIVRRKGFDPPLRGDGQRAIVQCSALCVVLVTTDHDHLSGPALPCFTLDLAEQVHTHRSPQVRVCNGEVVDAAGQAAGVVDGWCGHELGQHEARESVQRDRRRLWSLSDQNRLQ